VGEGLQKPKLNYRFHNPNSLAETADYILKIFLEVNEKKVEAAIKKAGEEKVNTEENDKGHFA